MSRKLVALICLLIFAGIIVWDASLYLDNVAGNSITQTVIAWSGDYPIIAWGIGFLMGGLTLHFYDPAAQGSKNAPNDWLRPTAEPIIGPCWIFVIWDDCRTYEAELIYVQKQIKVRDCGVRFWKLAGDCPK